MNATESIPQVWDDERDGQFFRVTAALFDSAFCAGAGVLLASYDNEVAAAVSREASAAPAPSASGSRIRIASS